MASEYLTNDGPFHNFNVREAAEVAIQLASEDAYLSALVNRNMLDDVLAGGGKGRAVNVRIPAALTARVRGLDVTKDAIVLDSLNERTEQITLGDHFYSAVALSEGEMNLDIENFSAQVLGPQADAVVDRIEEEVAKALKGIAVDESIEWSNDNPVATFTAIRKTLRDRGVPQAGMNVVVGTEVYARLLEDSLLTDASASGDTAALREGSVGKLRGFTVVESTRVEETDIIAFHKDAFVLAVRAPIVPSGQAGHIATAGGMQLRYLADYDTMHTAHRSMVSTFAGVKAMPLYVVKRNHTAGTASIDTVEGGAALHVSIAA